MKSKNIGAKYEKIEDGLIYEAITRNSSLVQEIANNLDVPFWFAYRGLKALYHTWRSNQIIPEHPSFTDDYFHIYDLDYMWDEVYDGSCQTYRELAVLDEVPEVPRLIQGYIIISCLNDIVIVVRRWQQENKIIREEVRL